MQHAGQCVNTAIACSIRIQMFDVLNCLQLHYFYARRRLEDVFRSVGAEAHVACSFVLLSVASLSWHGVTAPRRKVYSKCKV